tara:strand:- start:5527 stop:6570 length:1044 start_codon:yes stop_codon:yes gene_type:complete
MKNLITLSLLFCTFFFSCETDFEVNSNWKEVTVVYGLLDQSQEHQYIKINKAFIGDNENNAEEIAFATADSVNYSPENLEVKLYKLIDGNFGNFEIIDSIIFNDTILDKEEGLFSTENNIIYTIPTAAFLLGINDDDKYYRLSILNTKTSKLVSSETKLISTLKITTSDNKPLGFYSPIPTPPFSAPLEKSRTSVKWTPSENGVVYEIIARIHYTDFFQDDTVANYIDWIQPQILYNGEEEMVYTFEGDLFVNALASKIDNNNSSLIARRLSNAELFFTVGSQDLYTYISVNEPFEGIVQERPVFSNIENGIGLFSSRYNKTDIMPFSAYTREGIAIDLDSLGFIYP